MEDERWKEEKNRAKIKDQHSSLPLFAPPIHKGHVVRPTCKTHASGVGTGVKREEQEGAEGIQVGDRRQL